MSWDMSSDKSRNGAFRNLLNSVTLDLERRAEELWSVLPEPKSESATAIAQRLDLKTSGRAVIQDLLHLMIAEHAEFRRNLLVQFGSYADAKGVGTGMQIDNREQMASHLAARRMEARLAGRTPPSDFDGLVEDWMKV
ncbi:hypothetical protein NBRC116589_13550 [Ruegeria sp. HU-ET01832]